jgi:hypothetical protein
MSTLTEASRHGRTWSGHPRFSIVAEDVDARDKPGHDDTYDRADER